MLTPVGFWSYARQDDNHSDGQLSELRAVVGKAINLHRGEEVRLFQDTEAIPIGADWEATIESTIAQTTFFIPLITPKFLKSEHCRDVFRAFRRRMAAMGRHDLIFPVHYVDLDRIAPAETVFDDELLALRRQQWIDFRPLQYEDVKSSKVRRWADTLAASVLSAMSGAPSPQPAPARTPPPASSPRQEPAKTYAAASKERVIGSTAASLPAAAVRAIRRFAPLSALLRALYRQSRFWANIRTGAGRAGRRDARACRRRHAFHRALPRGRRRCSNSRRVPRRPPLARQTWLAAHAPAMIAFRKATWRAKAALPFGLALTVVRGRRATKALVTST